MGKAAIHRFIPLALVLAGCGQILALQGIKTEHQELSPGTYRLDPDHAVILWKVNHLGFSNFVGRFEKFDASLNFDPASPEKASIDVIIETAAIDSGVEALDEQLISSNFFASETFPQARFQSSQITITTNNEGKVTGDLTIRGISKPVTLDVRFQGGGTDFLRGNAEILGFEATTQFNRSDFGMTYLVPAIGDQVSLEIFLEFVKTGP